jgi:hypothetical protein
MASVIRYTGADFDKIQMDGFSYTLNPETMKIIQSIATQVGSPEYIKTPQFEKREINNRVIINGSRNKKNKSQEMNNEDWHSAKIISTTVINKKEGIDSSIDQIRKHLNKMTNKTYASLKEKIIEEIEKINNVEENDMTKIGEAIFSIASGNSFFSSMYAELFKELMEKFDSMRVIFDTNFDKFRSIFNTIDYCDPNTDYDKFCANNKMNEQRRAISLFYVNLMIQGVIPPGKLIDIIRDLQNYMNRIIVVEDNKSIVDELSEILYIIITNSYEKLKHVDGWKEIREFVVVISEMKTVNVASISNKTIFKHMDMLDVI